MGSPSADTASASLTSAPPPPPQNLDFPGSCRVLVVDGDGALIVAQMLQRCGCEVTACKQAVGALKILRERKDGFDIVLSERHLPDMDGFKFLEHVATEMHLPVKIMMSADDRKHVVMEGLAYGAFDCLIKPVKMEAITNILHQVISKKKKDSENSGSVESCVEQKRTDDMSSDNVAREDRLTMKKARVVWTVDLHQKFIDAVLHLGHCNAVPTKILDLMNVPGLTRENISSHLQKYRIYLKSVGKHDNRCKDFTHLQGSAGPDASYGRGRGDQPPLQKTGPNGSSTCHVHPSMIQFMALPSTNMIDGRPIYMGPGPGSFNANQQSEGHPSSGASSEHHSRQQMLSGGISDRTAMRTDSPLPGNCVPPPCCAFPFTPNAVNVHHTSSSQQQSRGHQCSGANSVCDSRQQMSLNSRSTCVTHNATTMNQVTPDHDVSNYVRTLGGSGTSNITPTVTAPGSVAAVNIDSENSGSVESCVEQKRTDDMSSDNVAREDRLTMKKARVVWTLDLHQKFIDAVLQLGHCNAVPKKILDLMNVPGLTRENVSNHLQEYRSYLKSVGKHDNRCKDFTRLQGSAGPDASYGRGRGDQLPLQKTGPNGSSTCHVHPSMIQFMALSSTNMIDGRPIYMGPGHGSCNAHQQSEGHPSSGASSEHHSRQQMLSGGISDRTAMRTDSPLPGNCIPPPCCAFPFTPNAVNVHHTSSSQQQSRGHQCNRANSVCDSRQQMPLNSRSTCVTHNATTMNQVTPDHDVGSFLRTLGGSGTSNITPTVTAPGSVAAVNIDTRMNVGDLNHDVGYIQTPSGSGTSNVKPAGTAPERLEADDNATCISGVVPNHGIGNVLHQNQSDCQHSMSQDVNPSHGSAQNFGMERGPIRLRSWLSAPQDLNAVPQDGSDSDT